MRILFLVHGLPPAACGGTETYTLGIAAALGARPGLDVAILTREADATRPELHLRREHRGEVDVCYINNTFQACTTVEDTYRNPALCAVALAAIDDLAPDLVHVQHLTALSTDLIAALASRGLPVVMTLNDYWPICHRGQLLDLDGRRCDGPGDAGCASCIPAGAAAPPGAWRAARRLRALPIPVLRSAPALVERLLPRGTGATRELSAARARQMRQMLTLPVALLAPSQTLRDEYLRFGVAPDRLVLCDQAAVVSDTVPIRTGSRSPGEPLRIVFAGSLMLSKGPHVVLDALAHLPAGSVTVDFLGAVAAYHGDTRYAEALQPRLGHPAVRRVGPVPHDRVPAALADADVLVVSSTWIENAPFVIREAFAQRVPVLASRLGGMADMVRDGLDGLLFSPGDGASLAAALQRLIDDPALLPRLRDGIRPPMSLDEEAAQLEALYRTHVDARRPGPSREPPGAAQRRRPDGDSITAVILNFGTPDESYLAARSVITSSVQAGVVIVDNGSGDDETLRNLLPDAAVIATGANLGFSGGCNVGIQAALERGADLVLLLNSDAVLHRHAIERLAAALRSDERAGIAAPVVFSLDEPGVVGTAGMRYNPGTGRMRHRAAGHRLSALGPAGADRVDGASGCALLVKREVFARIGPLDPEYFFTFEDLDFCLRARAAGFATVCVADAAVYHKGGRTIGPRSPARVYYGVRNHLRLAQKIAPAAAPRRMARSAAIVAFNLAYVGLSPDVRLIPGLAALVRGTIDHARGRYGPLVATPPDLGVE